MSTTTHSSVAGRWTGAGAGQRYVHGRWRTRRAAERDPRFVHGLLERHGLKPSPGGVLDVPCGTGRLAQSLAGLGAGYVGAEISQAMLVEAPPLRRVRASVFALPFRDDSFDAVVCCRLLHHFAEEADAQAALAELVRVARRLVIVSFWDSASWAAWRRRRAPRDARVARSREVLGRLGRAAGAEPLGFRAVLRFWSQQTFAVLAKNAGQERP